jgi:hypothetical protein
MPTETRKINDVYELLDAIRPRPALYFGDNKISSLSAFLSGYDFSTSVHNIEDKSVFPPFWYFHEWAMHKYNWCESTAGWKNIILKENGNNEEKALKVFFEMIDEFKTLHPLSIQKVLLNDQSLAFHHSDKCKIKTVGTDLSDRKPVYESASEVLLVEFSHSFGFSFFVVDKNKLIGTSWMERFKDLKSAKENIELLFGPLNNWQTLDDDLIKAIKQIL